MVTRRTMLAVTAGGAVGAALPAVAMPGAATAEPAAATGSVPRTLAAARAVRSGRLSVPRADFRVTHLSVQWRGPAAQVRFHRADGWTRWQTVGSCHGGRDDRDAVGSSALVLADDALGYEIWVAGAGPGQVTELNTMDGPATMTAAAVATSMPLPGGTACQVPYLSRAAWGADESLRDWDPAYYPVQTITVHHAGFTAGSDAAATVRGIYAVDAAEYGDMGYHFLIDDAGRVYEGRWSGTDQIPGFAAQLGGDGAPRMVTAAHVGGYNSGNIGICLLGDLTARQPTSAARESLTRLLTSLASVCGVDPLATVNFVNPADPTIRKTISAIPGHRQWDATACPGDAFYPKLGEIRTEVARRLAVPAPTRPRRTDKPDLPPPPPRVPGIG